MSQKNWDWRSIAIHGTINFEPPPQYFLKGFTLTLSPTVTVFIPGALLSRTGSRKRVSASGSTVREVIEALDRDYPGLRFNLCHETGELRPFVNLFLETEEVRYLQGLDTPVDNGSTIHIIHSVAGG